MPLASRERVDKCRYKQIYVAAFFFVSFFLVRFAGEQKNKRTLVLQSSAIYSPPHLMVSPQSNRELY